MRAPNSLGDGRVRVPNPGVTISYADDIENSMIYWRCEAPDCPSRVTEPGREPTPFVGNITYTDRAHGFTMLGAVAVAHATMLDQAPLASMAVQNFAEEAA